MRSCHLGLSTSIVTGIIAVVLLGGFITPSANAKEIIHFAFFNPDNEAKDPLTAVSAMKPFADYVGEEVGAEIQIHYLLRKKDLEKTFQKYKVGIALLSPLYYVENKERLKLEPFAMPHVGGDITYRLLLVVRKNSGYKSLEDLKGKALAYTALGQDNFDLLNKLVFEGKIAVQHHFSRLVEVPTPSAAVMSVMYKEADSACVTSGLFETLKELNPLIKREMKGLYLSPKILRSPFCYLKGNISEQTVAKMTELILKIETVPAGQQSIIPFKLDGFKKIRAEAFLPMIAKLESSGTPSGTASETSTAVAKVTKSEAKAKMSHASLTISHIRYRYLPSENRARLTAKVSPAKAAKEVNLIVQFSGNKRDTIPMKLDKKSTYSAVIELPAPAVKPSESSKKTREEIYIVKPGDTLGKISKKYYGEIKKWILIATYNQLPNPNLILVGQKLKIKLSGTFENVPFSVWVKAVDSKGEVVLSPERKMVITR